MIIKKISSIGNNCNFCNKPNEQKVVFEVRPHDNSIAIRFCPDCFKELARKAIEDSDSSIS